MKGFYVIVSPEYRNRKILPPELFIDDLFTYLNRKYHVGLLSAASLQASSHQQAMEYYIIIEKPPMHSTNLNEIKINYIVKNNLNLIGIEKRKTDAGYLKVSSSELTAVDLIEYYNRVGGLNRVATILYKLSETMSPQKLKMFWIMIYQKVLCNV